MSHKNEPLVSIPGMKGQLNTRAVNCLKYTVGIDEDIDWKKVCSMTRQELLKIPNIGTKTVDMIEMFLVKNKLSLKARRCPCCGQTMKYRNPMQRMAGL
jgi:DNA-directed RNA polymerase alpha subunit